MHKHISARVVFTVAIFLIGLLAIVRAGADSPSLWVSSPLSIQKQMDIQSLPSSLSDNIDCYMEDATNCDVPTAYGEARPNGTVRLNGSNDFKPVLSYIENRQRFLPIPNSTTAISYTAEPVFGLYLYFNYNFSSSVKLARSFGVDEYQIIKPPDGKLIDKAKHRLAADPASMSFSQNGQWMIVSDPNVAMLRVNLQTFEVVPFAPSFDYSVGLDPAVKTAITNDGRYAVVASKNFGVFKIYDLNTCAITPDTISGPAVCQSRDLNVPMRQQFANYSFTDSIRFLDNDNLSVYATSVVNNKNTTARYIINSNAKADGQIEYLALGDSYIVGEGAFDYQGGTDTSDNKCHLSLVAYPYLIGHDLNYDSYHSVACSGAVTQDITDTTLSRQTNYPQAKGKEDLGFDSEIYTNFEPGYRAQINFVSRYQPKIINLSVGGNDMGFSDILKQCVEPSLSSNTCYNNYEDRLELVNQINNIVYPHLIKTYQELKAAGPPDMRIYVIGYPQIAKPGGDCALNVHLNSDEILFSQNLISYLDAVIQIAAAKTGVYYVNAQDALNGHRLCEAEPGSVAMNGLTAGNDRPTQLGGPIADESYHPNQFGYLLMENKILSVTRNLTNPAPPPDLLATLSPLNAVELLNVPHINRPINTVEFDPAISPDIMFQQTPVDITLNGAAHALGPSTTLRAEIHSTPINIGTYTTGTNGDLTSQLTIPANVPAGYHTIHFFGTGISGQPVDIYKVIYVASNANDLDGNGTADSTQSCVGVPSSGQDFDKDGIDDACDGDITQPPAQTTQSVSFSAALSSQTNSLIVSTSSRNSSDPNSNQTDQPSRASPSVLAASSLKPGSQNKPTDNLQIPGRFYFTAGGAFISLTTLGYFFKRRLF
jgi:hypothetical protein